MSINNEAYFNVTFTLDTQFDERLKYFGDYVDQTDRIDWTNTQNLANYAFYKHDNSGLNYNLVNKYIKKEYDSDNTLVNNLGIGSSYKNMERFIYNKYHDDRQELFVSNEELKTLSTIRKKYEHSNLNVTVYSEIDIENCNNGSLLNFNDFKYSDIKIFRLTNLSNTDIITNNNTFVKRIKNNQQNSGKFYFDDICFIEDSNLFFVNHHIKYGDMSKTVKIINNKLFENTKDFTTTNIETLINNGNLLDKVNNNVNAINEPVINNPYTPEKVINNKSIKNSTNNLLSPFLISVRDPRNKGNEYYVKENFNDNKQNYLFDFNDINDNKFFSEATYTNNEILQDELNFLKLTNKYFLDENFNKINFSNISSISYLGNNQFSLNNQEYIIDNHNYIIFNISHNLNSINFNESIIPDVNWITKPTNNISKYKILKIQDGNILFNYIHSNNSNQLIYNYINDDIYNSFNFMSSPPNLLDANNNFISYLQLEKYINLDAPISNNYQSYSQSNGLIFNDLTHFFLVDGLKNIYDKNDFYYNSQTIIFKNITDLKLDDILFQTQTSKKIRAKVDFISKNKKIIGIYLLDPGYFTLNKTIYGYNKDITINTSEYEQISSRLDKDTIIFGSDSDPNHNNPTKWVYFKNESHSGEIISVKRMDKSTGFDNEIRFMFNLKINSPGFSQTWLNGATLWTTKEMNLKNYNDVNNRTLLERGDKLYQPYFTPFDFYENDPNMIVYENCYINKQWVKQNNKDHCDVTFLGSADKAYYENSFIWKITISLVELKQGYSNSSLEYLDILDDIFSSIGDYLLFGNQKIIENPNNNETYKYFSISGEIIDIEHFDYLDPYSERSTYKPIDDYLHFYINILKPFTIKDSIALYNKQAIIYKLGSEDLGNMGYTNNLSTYIGNDNIRKNTKFLNIINIQKIQDKRFLPKPPIIIGGGSGTFISDNIQYKRVFSDGLFQIKSPIDNPSLIPKRYKLLNTNYVIITSETDTGNMFRKLENNYVKIKIVSGSENHNIGQIYIIDTINSGTYDINDKITIQNKNGFNLIIENRSTLIEDNFVSLQNIKRNVSVSFSSNQVSKNYSLIDQKNNKNGLTDKLFTLFLHYYGTPNSKTTNAKSKFKLRSLSNVFNLGVVPFSQSAYELKSKTSNKLMITQKTGDLDNFDESLEFNTETFYNYKAIFNDNINTNGINNDNNDIINKNSSININDVNDKTLLKITSKGDIETLSEIKKYCIGNEGKFIETFKLDSCGNLILKNTRDEKTIDINTSNGYIQTKGDIAVITPMISLTNINNDIVYKRVNDHNKLKISDTEPQVLIHNNLLTSIANVQNFNCMIPIVNNFNEEVFKISCNDISLEQIHNYQTETNIQLYHIITGSNNILTDSQIVFKNPLNIDNPQPTNFNGEEYFCLNGIFMVNGSLRSFTQNDQLYFKNSLPHGIINLKTTELNNWGGQSRGDFIIRRGDLQDNFTIFSISGTSGSMNMKGDLVIQSPYYNTINTTSTGVRLNRGDLSHNEQFQLRDTFRINHWGANNDYGSLIMSDSDKGVSGHNENKRWYFTISGGDAEQRGSIKFKGELSAVFGNGNSDVLGNNEIDYADKEFVHFKVKQWKLQDDNKGDRGDMVMFKPDLSSNFKHDGQEANKNSTKYNSEDIDEDNFNYTTYSRPIFYVKGESGNIGTTGNIQIHKTFSDDSKKIFEIVRDNSNAHGTPILSLHRPDRLSNSPPDISNNVIFRIDTYETGNDSSNYWGDITSQGGFTFYEHSNINNYDTLIGSNREQRYSEGTFFRFANWNKYSRTDNWNKLYNECKWTPPLKTHGGDMYFVKDDEIKFLLEGHRGNMYLRNELNMGNKLNINDEEGGGEAGTGTGEIRTNNRNFELLCSNDYTGQGNYLLKTLNFADHVRTLNIATNDTSDNTSDNTSTINIGTGSVRRTIVMGNKYESTSFAINSGKGGINIVSMKTDGDDGISLQSHGGITNQYGNKKKYIIKNDGNNLKIELDDTSNSNEKITILNTDGSSNDAIKIHASRGGINISSVNASFKMNTDGAITNQYTNNQKYIIKNADNNVKIELDDTYNTSEKIKILNETGTDDDAIKITSGAGGIDISSVNASFKMNTLGTITNQYANNQKYIIKNAEDNVKIELDDASNSNEKITILNADGSGNDAIKIHASRGGIDLTSKVASFKMDTLGNITNQYDNNQKYTIKNTSNKLKIELDDTADDSEKITILNTDGIGNDAIKITSGTGGINISSVNASFKMNTLGTITNQYANNQKYIIKNAEDNVKIELDDTHNASEKIKILNETGTDDDAIKITSGVGGIDISSVNACFKINTDGTITNQYANNQKYIIKNAEDNVKIELDDTAAPARITISAPIIHIGDSTSEVKLAQWPYVGGVQVGYLSGLGDVDNATPGDEQYLKWVASSYQGKWTPTNLPDYALKTQLDSYALTTQLANYALTTKLSSYALITQLSDYATIGNLDTKQNKLADSKIVIDNEGNITTAGYIRVDGEKRLGQYWPGFVPDGIFGVSTSQIHAGVDVDKSYVWAKGYLSTSDIRIKDSIKPVDDTYALDIVNKIECKEYNYISPINRREHNIIGFIAQQVKEHLPNAVSNNNKKIIPSENRILNDISWNVIDSSCVMLTISNYNYIPDYSKETGKFKFYVRDIDTSGNPYNEETFEIFIEDDGNSFKFEKQWENVYFYGKEVIDFHNVDKNQIFALHHSAIQELSRRNDVKTKKIEILEKDLEQYLGSSDLRIKNDIEDVPYDEALSIINKIETKKYNYINPLKQKQFPIIGFIGQQIKKVLPNAVALHTYTIPDELRTVKVIWEQLDSSVNEILENSGENISKTEKWKFTVENDIVMTESHTGKCLFYLSNSNDVNEHNITLDLVDGKSFITTAKYENVFLYGKEVNDFHTIDKEQINALTVAACQELSRENIKLKARLDDIEERLNAVGI